jgi:hypothetical protein
MAMAIEIPPPKATPQYGYTGSEVRAIIGTDRDRAIRFAEAVRKWVLANVDHDVKRRYAEEMTGFYDRARESDDYAAALVADAVIKIPNVHQVAFIETFLAEDVA